MIPKVYLEKGILERINLTIIGSWNNFLCSIWIKKKLEVNIKRNYRIYELIEINISLNGERVIEEVKKEIENLDKKAKNQWVN